MTSMTYPTLEQVSTSGVTAVLRWNRGLPSPRSDDEVAVLDAVVKRLAELRADDPGAFTTASKQLWRG